MAKNYKYNRTITGKFTIKGIVSENGDEIEYENADKEIKTISVEKIFSNFTNEEVTLSISLKADEDLSDAFEDE